MQKPLRAHRAVSGKNRAIGALVESGAQLTFTRANELNRFPGCESGEVVNVLGTMAAEAGALVPFHVLPAGGARGGDAEIRQRRFVCIHNVSTQLDGIALKMLPRIGLI
jgi:hypothetical protein